MGATLSNCPLRLAYFAAADAPNLVLRAASPIVLRFFANLLGIGFPSLSYFLGPEPPARAALAAKFVALSGFIMSVFGLIFLTNILTTKKAPTGESPYIRALSNAKRGKLSTII